ncbi:MAG: FG-GAP repeat protein, partial [Chloroflexi bacterium]|nr:FG-GAP repeat protein [Chloroflexota bacterium]
MNGDGIDDLRIGAPNTTIGLDANAGKTFIVFGQAGGFGANLDLSTLNGTNGFVIEGNAADQKLGFSGSAIGDFNGDGFGDLLIGAPMTSDPLSAGSAYVVFGHAAPFPTTLALADLDGTNGFAILGIDAEDFTGFNVAGVGDVNGDGYDDLVVGAHGGDPDSGLNRGEAYLVFGHGGAFSAVLSLASVPGNGGMVINGIDNSDFAGRYVSGAGDVNGDGYDDLLVAARDSDVGVNGNAGETYLIFGRDFTGVVTQAGGATGETLTGSPARDVIIAGAGDDELVGNGGQDVLRAGEGDDVLAVSDTAFARLAGGNGFDTLRLDGLGITLDLTAISDFVLTGLEQIDIRGTGANSLTLDVREVLNLSDTTNTLLVLSESDDTVDIGAGWTNTGSELINGKTFDVFTQGLAVVKVFTDADTTDPVVTVDPLNTTDTTPQLTGTVVDADPATTIEVTVNGTAYPATNNGDGTWTLADNVMSSLADGVYDVIVTATDVLGGVTRDTTTDELVIDTTRPSIFIEAPSATSTSSGPVSYTVTYAGADVVSLTPRDVTLEATGTATGEVSVSGAGTESRTVTIANITGSGTIGISIAAGTAQDLAGNIAPAPSFPGQSFDVVAGPIEGVGEGAGEGEVVSFGDSDLEARIRVLLSQPTGDISSTDLLSITELAINDAFV